MDATEAMETPATATKSSASSALVVDWTFAAPQSSLHLDTVYATFGQPHDLHLATQAPGRINTRVSLTFLRAEDLEKARDAVTEWLSVNDDQVLLEYVLIDHNNVEEIVAQPATIHTLGEVNITWSTHCSVAIKINCLSTTFKRGQGGQTGFPYALTITSINEEGSVCETCAQVKVFKSAGVVNRRLKRDDEMVLKREEQLASNSTVSSSTSSSLNSSMSNASHNASFAGRSGGQNSRLFMTANSHATPKGTPQQQQPQQQHQHQHQHQQQQQQQGVPVAMGRRLRPPAAPSPLSKVKDEEEDSVTPAMMLPSEHQLREFHQESALHQQREQHAAQRKHNTGLRGDSPQSPGLSSLLNELQQIDSHASEEYRLSHSNPPHQHQHQHQHHHQQHENEHWQREPSFPFVGIDYDIGVDHAQQNGPATHRMRTGELDGHLPTTPELLLHASDDLSLSIPSSPITPTTAAVHHALVPPQGHMPNSHQPPRSRAGLPTVTTAATSTSISTANVATDQLHVDPDGQLSDLFGRFSLPHGQLSHQAPSPPRAQQAKLATTAAATVAQSFHRQPHSSSTRQVDDETRSAHLPPPTQGNVSMSQRTQSRNIRLEDVGFDQMTIGGLSANTMHMAELAMPLPSIHAPNTPSTASTVTVTTLSPSSTTEDVAAWLYRNSFSEDVQKALSKYTGSTLFLLTKDHLQEIAGVAEGIRMYVCLHNPAATRAVETATDAHGEEALSAARRQRLSVRMADASTQTPSAA